MRTLLVFCLVLTALLHPPAAAQLPPQPPARAILPAGADTNRAASYYTYGLAMLDSRPEEAADAFYWATRLEPGWADAWYARRIAMIVARPELVGTFLQRANGKEGRNAQRLSETDSLYLHALALDPFVAQRLDWRAMLPFLRNLAPRELREKAGPTALEGMLRMAAADHPEMEGLIALADGRYPDALESYAEMQQGVSSPSGIHAERARLFLWTDQPDSALAEMRQAVAQIDKGRGRVLFRLDSRALLEHSVGVILERLGDRDGAREAYLRAARADTLYHPAHAALSSLALAAGDTAGALREMELAVRIRPDDPTLRYQYGRKLAFAGRRDEAEAQVREALRLEPLYAPSYALLGGLLEMRGEPAKGLEQYRAFMAHASREHALVPAIEERISALAATAPATP